MLTRSLFLKVVLAVSVFTANNGCTSTETEGNTEPVAPDTPEAEGSGYPEDPEMGAPSGEEAAAVEPKTPEEDTPGELTDDPYSTLPDQESNEPSEDLMTKPNPPEVDVPDSESDISGSFEEPQPDYGPAPESDGPTVDEPFENQGLSVEKPTVTRYVKAVLLNVRQKPSSRSPIVRRFYGGAKLKVQIHGKYAKLKEGQWVHTKYLSSKPTKKMGKKDVQAAWKRSKYKDTWKRK